MSGWNMLALACLCWVPAAVFVVAVGAEIGRAGREFDQTMAEHFDSDPIGVRAREVAARLWPEHDKGQP